MILENPRNFSKIPIFFNYCSIYTNPFLLLIAPFITLILPTCHPLKPAAPKTIIMLIRTTSPFNVLILPIFMSPIPVPSVPPMSLQAAWMLPWSRSIIVRMIPASMSRLLSTRRWAMRRKMLRSAKMVGLEKDMVSMELFIFISYRY